MKLFPLIRKKDVEEHEDVHQRLSEQEQKTLKLESRVKRIELEVGIVGRHRELSA